MCSQTPSHTEVTGGYLEGAMLGFGVQGLG